MKKITEMTAAIGVACLIGGTSLLAHTPYVLPNVFSTSKGEKVTAMSSFTEEFFVPDFKVESEDFHLVLPSGERAEYGNIGIFDQLTILENSLEEEGTYRLSTGDRLGRKFKMKFVDGAWDYVARGMGENAKADPIPKGVKVAEFQSQTVAVAYVTKGVPTQGALKQSGSGLEIVPTTHPSEVYVKEPFKFVLTFNGKAVKGHEMSIFRQGGEYEEPKYKVETVTGKKGNVSAVFDEPGVYVVMTRHKDLAPEGSETPYRSYTISLTFEVQR
ncbi:MAG: DUF4198 domain-containing protein [Opitutaceae bacterium]|nr:DUF4198 domain-containing protein [Opitutaceae bacterium]